MTTLPNDMGQPGRNIKLRGFWKPLLVLALLFVGIPSLVLVLSGHHLGFDPLTDHSCAQFIVKWCR